MSELDPGVTKPWRLKSPEALALALALGCHAVTPPRVALAPGAALAPIVPVDAAAPERPPSVPRADPCARIAETTQGALDAAIGRAEQWLRQQILSATDPLAPSRASLVEPRALDLAREQAFLRQRPSLQHITEQSDSPFRMRNEQDPTCLRSPGGAWGLVFVDAMIFPNSTDWTYPDSWTGSGRLRVAHVGPSGALRTADLRTAMSQSTDQEILPEGFPRRFSDANCCSFFGGSVGETLLFDFDADGEPELFVSSRYAHEGEHFDWAEIYSMRAGELVAYPRPAGFELSALEDVDRDGRPDLISSPAHDAGSHCGSGFGAYIISPRFVAFSTLDGGFDPTGARAQAVARSGCPHAPSVLGTVEDVVCARLWGQSAAGVERAIRQRHRPWSCEREEAGRPQAPRALRAYDGMMAALAVRLPFTLDAEARRGANAR